MQKSVFVSSSLSLGHFEVKYGRVGWGVGGGMSRRGYDQGHASAHPVVGVDNFADHPSSSPDHITRVTCSLLNQSIARQI